MIRAGQCPIASMGAPKPWSVTRLGMSRVRSPSTSSGAGSEVANTAAEAHQHTVGLTCSVLCCVAVPRCSLHDARPLGKGLSNLLFCGIYDYANDWSSGTAHAHQHVSAVTVAEAQ